MDGKTIFTIPPSPLRLSEEALHVGLIVVQPLVL